jgi:hypothetical protein
MIIMRESPVSFLRAIVPLFPSDNRCTDARHSRSHIDWLADVRSYIRPGNMPDKPLLAVPVPDITAIRFCPRLQIYRERRDQDRYRGECRVSDGARMADCRIRAEQPIPLERLRQDEAMHTPPDELEPARPEARRNHSHLCRELQSTANIHLSLIYQPSTRIDQPMLARRRR